MAINFKMHVETKKLYQSEKLRPEYPPPPSPNTTKRESSITRGKQCLLLDKGQNGTGSRCYGHPGGGRGIYSLPPWAGQWSMESTRWMDGGVEGWMDGQSALPH